MREIKFKAWDKVNNKMLSWEEICEECLITDILTCNLYIPLQYIGLKDFEGNELYEGDVYVNTTDINDKYTVYFENGSFTGGKSQEISTPLGFECEYDAYDEPTGDLVQDYSFDIKVVGNIYEGLKIDL